MKILIHSNTKELDRDLTPVNYETLFDRYQVWGGNAGNKLFLSAANNICCADFRNEVQYFSDEMTVQEINEKFDIIIWPLANCFSPDKTILGYLKKYTERIKQYKIPVIALGAGAQAASYDEIEFLTDAVREVAVEFITAVKDTGGTFGLRGYFTKELFERLGFYDDYVIGCPSLYQMGRDLKIHKSEIKEPEKLKISFNGNQDTIKYLWKNKYFDVYNSIWMDQGEFIPLLYGNEIQGKCTFRKIRSLIKKYSYPGLVLVCSQRLFCIYDMPCWGGFLKSQGINFSFGQRIHGNLISIMEGIPAAVAYCDSRTRELAEFFEIPTIDLSKEKVGDLFEFYEKISFEVFNKTFQDKFDCFDKLLQTYGFVSLREVDMKPFANAEQYDMPQMNVEKYKELKRSLYRPYVSVMKIFWSNEK